MAVNKEHQKVYSQIYETLKVKNPATSRAEIVERTGLNVETVDTYLYAYPGLLSKMKENANEAGNGTFALATKILDERVRRTKC